MQLNSRQQIQFRILFRLILLIAILKNRHKNFLLIKLIQISSPLLISDLETYTWINISSNSNSYTQASTAPASWSSSQPTSSSSASRFIDGPRPDARYGHSQITLDAERILVVGGCGGPNKQFDDAWILHWPLDVNVNARWERVSVRGLINAPVQFYCVPLVQCCGNKLVTFGKPRAPTNQTTTNNSLSLAIDDRNDAADKDVMTIHGAVKQPRLRVCSCSDPISSPSPSTSAPVSTSSSADGIFSVVCSSFNPKKLCYIENMFVFKRRSETQGRIKIDDERSSRKEWPKQQRGVLEQESIEHGQEVGGP